jgi:hypothetical protein
VRLVVDADQIGKIGGLVADRKRAVELSGYSGRGGRQNRHDGGGQAASGGLAAAGLPVEG